MVRSPFPIALIAGLILACGDTASVDPSSLGNPLLAHVPEDSTYVMATGEPYPEDFWQRVQRLQERMAPTLNQQIETALDDPTLEIPEASRAALGKVLGQLFTQTYALGDEDAHMVVYGRPLAPTLRMTLQDAAGMASALDELVSQGQLEAADSGGRRYWRLGLDDWVAVMTLAGSTLAAGVSPAAEESSLVAHLTSEPGGRGGEMAEAKLAEVRSRHGFAPHLAGVLDTEATVRALLARAPAGGLAQQPECQTEILGYVRAVPRLALGYDELSDTSMRYRMIVELDPEIATELSAWSAPMPRLSGSDELVTLGLALDGQRILRTLGSWAQQRASEPSACGGASQLDPMAVPGAMMGLGAVGNPQSIHIALNAPEGGDVADAARWGFSALVRAESPQSIAMLAAQRLPLEPLLSAGGEPVKLPPMAGLPIPVELWGIATDEAIGLSTGEGAAERLRSMANGPKAPTGTLFGMHMDLGKLAGALETQLREGGMLRQMAEQQASANGESVTEEIDRNLQFLGVYAESFGRIEMNLRATSAGLELEERIEFR